MTDDLANLPTLTPAAALAAPADRAAAVQDIEQAFQRQMEPLLQRLKLVTLDVIDEVGRKHGGPLLAQVRQAAAETTAVLLRAELAALVERVTPAVREGSAAVRRDADQLLGELKHFINQTVVEAFQVHVPEYSRWAGQRVLDYFLAGTLFCLAAVLLCVGGILALQWAGLPPFAAYLLGGGAALAAGVVLLNLRSQHWRGTTGGPGALR
jgi:hypothetical protein